MTVARCRIRFRLLPTAPEMFKNTVLHMGSYLIGLAVFLLLWGLWGLLTGAPFLGSVLTAVTQGGVISWTVYFAVLLAFRFKPSVIVVWALIQFGLEWCIFAYLPRASRGAVDWGALAWYGLKPLIQASFYMVGGLSVLVVAKRSGFAFSGFSAVRGQDA